MPGFNLTSQQIHTIYTAACELFNAPIEFTHTDHDPLDIDAAVAYVAGFFAPNPENIDELNNICNRIEQFPCVVEMHAYFDNLY